MKVGIIRCQQTEDMCPGTMDFIVTSEGKMAFAETGPVKIVGFVSCGISKGNPISFPCPHYAEIKECIAKKLGPGIKIIEWTH